MLKTCLPAHLYTLSQSASQRCRGREVSDAAKQSNKHFESMGELRHCEGSFAASIHDLILSVMTTGVGWKVDQLVICC